jgi:hypothetical protein
MSLGGGKSVETGDIYAFGGWFSGPDTLSQAGSATIELARTGSTIRVLWDGQEIHSVNSGVPISAVGLRFGFGAYKGNYGTSIFASESVDVISVSGTAATSSGTGAWRTRTPSLCDELRDQAVALGHAINAAMGDQYQVEKLTCRFVELTLELHAQGCAGWEAIPVTTHEQAVADCAAGCPELRRNIRDLGMRLDQARAVGNQELVAQLEDQLEALVQGWPSACGGSWMVP